MVRQLLSCDWGTTSFRLRWVNAEDGKILAESTAGKGIAAVYNDWKQSGLPENERMGFYKKIIQQHINTLGSDAINNLPVIVSGMASSAIGISELPYGDIPFTIDATNLFTREIPADNDCAHSLLLVSGLKTNNDVMRGEETMLVGAEIPGNEESLLIFPGTHSKHLSVKNKILTGTRSFMTGELFDLLSSKSILSASVKKNESGMINSAFAEGVKEGTTGNLLNIIFHVRTNQLLGNISHEANYDFLSGLLLGCELNYLPGNGNKLYLVCGAAMADRYTLAIELICPGRKMIHIDADKALIRAHCKLAKHFF